MNSITYSTYIKSCQVQLISLVRNMTSTQLLFFISFLPALVYSSEKLSDKPILLNHKYVPSVLSDALHILALNQKCLSRGLFECLRFKFLVAIDRAVQSTDILEVTHGVHFIKNPDVVAAYNRSEARAFLDSNINVRSFLIEKLKEFLSTHLLQVK